MSSVFSQISQYLPQHEGLLPKWLLFISAVSVWNSVQCYSTLALNKRVYNGTVKAPSPPSGSSKKIPAASADISPVTPLSARTFGTWTLITSIVRLYAAYHISNPQVYELGLATYVVAWGHFVSEWLIFGTAKWGPGLASPFLVSTTSTIWMIRQWSFYVK